MAEARQGLRKRAKDLSKTLAWWFRDRYKLPPNDPQFLALTYEDLLLERWADYYARNPNASTTEAVNDEFDLDALMAADDSEWETLLDESR